tara:strand:+ start:453 stop:1244 length:792 start_codon:yes stop_codon:yes gene_type:complete
MATNTTQNTKPSFPTEEFDLPSKGLLYPKDNPLSSGKLELKYMTAKEEDILTSPNLIKKGIVLDTLMKSLIVSPINYDDLCVGDKNGLMVASRLLSYGKDYEVEVTCPECGNKEKITIDLSKIESKPINEKDYSNGNQFSFELPNSKRMVEFKLLDHRTEKAIEAELKALKKIESRTGISQEMTTRLKHLITSIDGDTNKGAIRNFVDVECLALDSRALRTEIERVQPDTDLSFVFTCSNCGYEDVNMEIPLTADFFWPKAGK